MSSTTSRFLKLGFRYVNMAQVTHVHHVNMRVKASMFKKESSHSGLQVYTNELGFSGCSSSLTYPAFSLHEGTKEYDKLLSWLESNST